MSDVTYSHIYQFTDYGLKLFKRVMMGEIAETTLDPIASGVAEPLLDTNPLKISTFETAREMAVAICDSLSPQSPQSVADNIELWAWLTYILRDVLFPVSGGVRKIKEYHRWFPAAPNDWQKAQRHLVRMPAILYATLEDDADHLICGKPGTGPEIREQLTSQQDMFNANFQRACRTLYYDQESGSVKKGAGGKDSPGVPRRLAAVRKQLDVTWDMTDLPYQTILKLLPPEFNKFKPVEFQGE